MKRYLNIFLCTFVVLLSFFAIFKINTTVKAVDKDDYYSVIELADNIEKDKKEKTKEEKIKKEIKITKPKVVVKKKTTVVKTSTAKQSVPKKKTIVKPKSVKYGTYGRLYVPGYSVALYDFNVNMRSSSSLQTIVNNQDSAAYYITHDKYVIADHHYQGFSVLTTLSVGATSYIKFKDGTTIRYKLIKKSKGVNTGPDLKDTNGNSFFGMRSDIIMYTCYEDGIMATLWVLA